MRSRIALHIKRTSVSCSAPGSHNLPHILTRAMKKQPGVCSAMSCREWNPLSINRRRNWIQQKKTSNPYRINGTTRCNCYNSSKVSREISYATVLPYIHGPISLSKPYTKAGTAPLYPGNIFYEIPATFYPGNSTMHFLQQKQKVLLALQFFHTQRHQCTGYYCLRYDQR